ncbi:MAG: M15 family metallopeptidase [Minisyncoccia bacterium]
MTSQPHHSSKLDLRIVTFVCTIVALVLAGFVAYQYRLLGLDLKSVEGENLKLTTELTEAEGTISYLLEENTNQQAIIDNFEGQISSIGSTVGTLEKLSQTDKELLRKYSKVFFLSENYRPAGLAVIDQKYLYQKEDAFANTEVMSYLEQLLKAARSDGIELLIASAFRSFETQASLKSEYKVIYGAGTANQFSADQGYSEHQLGTAMDFTTPAVGGVFSKFQADPAYKWLQNNAHKYGFVLSYPENNAYYKFEPWHWRFVGVSLATDLHQDGKYFYDLDQREIDAYLIKLFD